MNSLREVNVWGLHVICSNLLMMIVAAVMLAATTDLRLFLSVAWLGLVLLFANHVYLKKAAGMWQIVREGWTRVSTNMAENITGMRVVTAFNRQVPNLGVFNRLQDEQHRQQRADVAHQRRLPAAARPDRLRRASSSSSSTAAT